MTGFRLVASEPLADAGFLRVAGHTIEGPAGERHTRYVVHHPGAVVVVPVDDGATSALLVRQYRAATGGEVLEVPAGKRDVAGESPAETARRELGEELGRHARRLVKLCEFWNSPGFCDEYTHLFAAFDLSAVAATAAATAEEAHMTVEPVRFDAVEDLVATRALVDAKSIVGLLLTRLYLSGSYGGVEA